MKEKRIKGVAYWLTTVLGPVSFVIAGFLHLSHSTQVLATLSHLGYPVYFANILGFWKLAGAIAIAIPRFPRLKEWAYAGFFFDLTGASASPDCWEPSDYSPSAPSIGTGTDFRTLSFLPKEWTWSSAGHWPVLSLPS